MRAIVLCMALLVFLSACSSPPSGAFVLDSDPCRGSSDADTCYFELVKNNQTFACPLIEAEGLRSICYIEAVKWDAREEHCKQVRADDRKYCYAELGIALEDYVVCDRSEGLSQQYCREQVIEAKNEPDNCDTLTAPVWRNTCFAHFGKLLSDELLCFKISSDTPRDGCVYNVSIATNDVKLCHSIVNEQPGTAFEERFTTAGCVTDIAKETLDFTACEEIGDAFNVEVCQYRVAVASGDVHNCDELSIVAIRDACVERLSDVAE